MSIATACRGARPAVAASPQRSISSSVARGAVVVVDKAYRCRANRRGRSIVARESNDATECAAAVPLESRSSAMVASRRGALSAALASALASAVATRPALADGDDRDVAAPTTDVEPAPAAPAPAASAPVPPVRYKGSSPGNWSVVVPGEYRRMSTEKPRRIYEQRTDCEPNCRDLQAKRTEETPLVARFGSVDEREDVSVSVRGANTLKLTFLSMKDVTEFGAIEEATPLFVPPGAKIVSTNARTGESGKGYYQWDFEYGAARVLLTAAVEQGNCYLLGATAASERWDASEAGFRRASASFRVGADAVVAGGAPAVSAKEREEPPAGEVRLDDGSGDARRKPPGTLDCKGPLPILCSVED